MVLSELIRRTPLDLGMLVNELPPAEAARMRDKLSRVNASIAVEVGQDLWKETQDELAELRGTQ